MGSLLHIDEGPFSRVPTAWLQLCETVGIQSGIACENNSRVLALRPTAVDLFCGAGGLSYGLKLAGISIQAGIDVDPACRHPFEFNVKAKFLQRNLFTTPDGFIGSLFPEGSPRILAGCAPCQPFSDYTKRVEAKRDQWELVRKFARIVNFVRPEIVTMENVPRLENHSVFDEFTQVLSRAGYEVHTEVVRC